MLYFLIIKTKNYRFAYILKRIAYTFSIYLTFRQMKNYIRQIKQSPIFHGLNLFFLYKLQIGIIKLHFYI